MVNNIQDNTFLSSEKLFDAISQKGTSVIKNSDFIPEDGYTYLLNNSDIIVTLPESTENAGEDFDVGRSFNIISRGYPFEIKESGINSVILTPDGTTKSGGTGELLVPAYQYAYFTVTYVGNAIIDKSTFVFNEGIDVFASTLFSLDFNNDNSLLAAAGNDSAIKIYETENFTLSQTLSEHTNIIYSAKFSNDGAYLAACGNDGNLYVFKSSDWSLFQTIPIAAGIMYDLDWNYSDSRIAIGSDSGVIVVETTGWTVSATLTDAASDIEAVDFNEFGNLLAAGSNDNNVYIYDGTFTLIQTLTDAASSVQAVDFSTANSSYLATGESSTVRVYETSGWTVVDTSTPTTGTITSIEFSPTDNFLALVTSGGGDECIVLDSTDWSVAGNITGGNEFVYSVSWSGNFLLSFGGAGGFARTYNAGSVSKSWQITGYGSVTLT